MWLLLAAISLGASAERCTQPKAARIDEIEKARTIAEAFANKGRSDAAPKPIVSVDRDVRKRDHWNVLVYYEQGAFGSDYSFRIRRCDGAIVDYMQGR